MRFLSPAKQKMLSLSITIIIDRYARFARLIGTVQNSLKLLFIHLELHIQVEIMNISSVACVPATRLYSEDLLAPRGKLFELVSWRIVMNSV